MKNAIVIPQQVQAEINAGALFVVNHSGGKDSQAMTLALQDILPAVRVLVVHAELPEVDWDGLREHIEDTIPAGWPVVYTRSIKTFFQMVERRFEARPDVPAFPSPSNRQCTSDLKRDPIARAVRHHLKDHPFTRVVTCMGIRAEESASRAKAVTWKLNKRETLKNGSRTVHEWLPIHDWSEVKVRATVAEAGQKLHWAYGAGMTRLSCCFCIMGSKADLRTAGRLRPELAKRYTEMEERTGYTMSMARVPLKDIISTTTSIPPRAPVQVVMDLSIAA